jgi:hypothetical protein
MNMKQTVGMACVALVLAGVVGAGNTGQAQGARVDPKASSSSLYYLDVLDGYFYRAYINWLNGDDRYAALEIKKGMEMIEAVVNFDDEAKNLFRTVGQLRQLRTDLDSGKTLTLKDLKHVFGDVHTRLARFYYYLADTHQRQNNTVDAGYSLRQGYHHIAHAVLWSGLELDPVKFSVGNWQMSRAAVIDVVERLSKKTPVAADSLKGAMDFLRDASAELSRRLNTDRE